MGDMYFREAIHMIKRVLKKLSSLARKKLRFVGFNVPIVFFLIIGLSIIPIGMAFGEGEPEPTGNNIADLVEVFNVEFHTGSPGDEGTQLPNLTYTDGTSIKNGNFWIYFEWQLTDLLGGVENGDYFDVVLDLGLDSIEAEVATQVGTFAPIISLGDGSAAGTIKWINESTYQSQKRIVIRIALDDPEFTGLKGDGTEERRVAGTGVWGFQYKAGSGAGDKIVYWEIIVGENGLPTGTIPVDPEPPTTPDEQQNGKPNSNPYDEEEYGYEKIGGRLTLDSTPVIDTIFYWGIQINGHKHKTYEEWANCPDNHDNKTYNDDPPLPSDGNGNFLETFTIVDNGKNTAPTWLRNVTNVSGKPVIHTNAPLPVNRSEGYYGQTLGETSGPAYLKLFYVNSEYIWQDRIEREGSGYRTQPTDKIPEHQPTDGKTVGSYDPYYTTWVLKEGERSALMYAPNGSEAGGKYNNYLRPVPVEDIKAIRMTQNGFEIDMYTSGVLGETLAIGYMTKPATDETGNFNTEIGNSVSIVGVNDGDPLAGASGAVLIGGTIKGGKLASPNKGNFVIEKYDYNEAQKMPNVAFSVIVSSEDKELEAAAIALIATQKENSPTPGTLMTDANGKLSIKLPDLPWAGGKSLFLTITETAPEGHYAVKPFTVEIEPENGMVTVVTPGSGEGRFVQLAPDQFGVIVWNRSTEKDMSVYDAALLKWIKKVDREIGGETVPIYYNNEVNEDIVSVKNGDMILFRIDVFNHCYNELWISEIIDELPRGLVFDEDFTIAHIEPDKPAYTNKGLWELDSASGSEPVKIKYIGPKLYLEPWKGVIGEYPECRLPLVLKVAVPEDIADGTPLINFAKITKMENNKEEDVTDEDPTPENNEDIAIVKPNNELFISCEVDKDTIRRTSAAYVSPPGREGFDNIEDNERYRYDVNFRSTSNIAADEFVLDDPLENVKNGQVRLEMLVTPVVWGDVDGVYNLWYKTNKTKDTTVYDSTTTALDDGVEQRWKNVGYKLWAENLSATTRVKLEVAALGLDEDEYVTALRFEFGAVYVGFTSKNYSSVSLNGQHRDTNGDLTLAQEDLDKIEGLKARSARPNATPAAAPQTVTAQSEGNVFTKLFSGLFGKQTEPEEPAGQTEPVLVTALADTTPFGIGGPDDGVSPGDYVDWTPDPSRPDYSPGALNASGLSPISYLVSAPEPMEDEHIVSSASSMIAKGDLWDQDIDAVLTLQLTTFMMDPEEGLGLNQWSSFSDEIPKLAPTTLEGSVLSRTPRTFDEMKPGLWIAIALASAFGAMLLLRFYNMRKRRVAFEQRGRRYAR